MKKRVSKWIAISLTLILAVSIISACGGGGSESTATPKPASTTAPPAATQAPADDKTDDIAAVQARDLGGRAFTIGDWWTNNNAEEAAPSSMRDELWLDYRDGIFEQYNFTMKQISIGGWGEHVELFTTSTMAQSPVADVYIMGFGWAASLMSQGLLYPLNTLDSLDFTMPKWNDKLTETFSMGGNVYATTAAQFLEPRNFLFFNKRLFADAGIDPEEPYDLQKSGQWTWDVFMDYCQRLTRDLDFDGIPDTYGFVAFQPEAIPGFAFANDARQIGRDANGKFYNGMVEPNYIEAVAFGKSIMERGYWAPSPEGASWDWFVTGFHDGHAAMIIREMYSTGTWADMDDDWGVVYPPKGPRATNYNTYASENVYCLPFNLSKDNAEDIAFAWNLFTNPLPYDLENPDAWKDGGWGYSRYRDTRVVDETLVMFANGLYEIVVKDFVTGIDWGPLFEWNALSNSTTAAEDIEAARPVVDAAIAEANSR